MKVVMCPADMTGCGFYRMLEPARVLKEDIDIEIRTELSLVARNHRVHRVSPLECDVLVIQRPQAWWIPQAIPMWQANGITVVCELDDDLASTHPHNAAYPAVHPLTSPEANYKFLKEACARADLVTVSTDNLANFYGIGHNRVIRNYIPEKYLEIGATAQEFRDGKTIGWPGTVATHPHDLQQTWGGVDDVLAAHEMRFKVIGPGERVRENLYLTRPVQATGWVELDDYPEAVASLDFGIVPLADTRFNRSKSWLKGLEFAALGVPFVCSPLPEYQALGAGYGAVSRRRNWKTALTQVIEHADEYRCHGREIAKVCTIEGNAWRYAEAWEDGRGSR